MNVSPDLQAPNATSHAKAARGLRATVTVSVRAEQVETDRVSALMIITTATGLVMRVTPVKITISHHRRVTRLVLV